MESIDRIKECIMCGVESEIANLQSANYEELGAAIDMIKDLAETKYYCAITKAMEERNEGDEQYDIYRYYTEKIPPTRPRNRMDWRRDFMYPDDEPMSDSWDTPSMYNDMPNDNNGKTRSMPYRDEREGKSPMRRKMYIESKKLHKDRSETLQELEDYAQGLTSDVIEMIKDSTPEEKNVLRDRISQLAAKIV